MTMLFITYGDALKSILAANQGSDFVTVGYTARRKDALEYEDVSRTVEVTYKGGQFPKSAGSRQEAQNHQMTFHLDLTVSQAVEADLATLESPASTDGQRATAIAAAVLAEERADQSMDAFVDLVYQIVMAADNNNLGLDRTVTPWPANTWVSGFEKYEPAREGDLVVIRGRMVYTMQGSEEITGVNPVTGQAIEITLDLPGDDVQQWEVTTTP